MLPKDGKELFIFPLFFNLFKKIRRDWADGNIEGEREADWDKMKIRRGSRGRIGKERAIYKFRVIIVHE